LVQCRQQQFLVLRGDQLIELVLAHRLGEKLGDAAIEVRQYVAQALRLATEGIPGVQIGIVVNLDERFEADTQALAVVQDAAVVIGNSPGSGIEIEVLVETAGLLKPPSSVKRSPPRNDQQRPPARSLYSSTRTL
jgi:hypothetical protein